MLKKIGERPLDANARLRKLVNDVDIYVLEHECNPLSFLRAGSHIWVRREECYEVYELLESWDRQKTKCEDFVAVVCLKLL